MKRNSGCQNCIYRTTQEYKYLLDDDRCAYYSREYYDAITGKSEFMNGFCSTRNSTLRCPRFSHVSKWVNKEKPTFPIKKTWLQSFLDMMSL